MNMALSSKVIKLIGLNLVQDGHLQQIVTFEYTTYYLNILPNC